MITSEQLNLSDVGEVPVLAIVRLTHDQPGVYRQVTLRQDKISKSGLIRFGDTPGDEALGWQDPQFVYVCKKIGSVDLETSKVTPYQSNK